MPCPMPYRSRAGGCYRVHGQSPPNRRNVHQMPLYGRSRMPSAASAWRGLKLDADAMADVQPMGESLALWNMATLVLATFATLGPHTLLPLPTRESGYLLLDVSL
jgi:hypothetical protein